MLIITHRLKQPIVIRNILAGMIIGPYTPPFSLIQNVNSLNTFAELGIIMLLFVIGTYLLPSLDPWIGFPESVGTLLIVFCCPNTWFYFI